MKTFKEFLASKNISEDSFNDMDYKEIAKLYSEWQGEVVKYVNETLAKATTQKEIDEAVKGLAKEQSIIDLQTSLKTIQEDLAVIKESGQGDVNKEGSFVKFIKERIESKEIENGKYSATMDMDAKQLMEAVLKDPALMTTANVTPNVAGGFNQLFGNFIDSTIYSAPKADPFILPLVDVKVQPGTESIWYVQRVNEEGDAAFIGEGDAKPLADAEWAESKAPIKEVAIFWKFSKRLTQNAPSVVSDFRSHANELVELKIDDGVFAGDNTGDELNGVVNQAASWVVPTALANYYDTPNIFDAVMAAATKIRLGNHKGQITAVLNTVWKAKMMGTKAADSKMYFLPEFVAPNGETISDVKVVFTNQADADVLTIGVLKNFKVVISQNVEYYEGYENDDFRKNLMSKKLEAFLGTYFPSNLGDSIISDDIATILTSIDLAGA